MKNLYFFPNEWDIDYDSHATVAKLKLLPNYAGHRLHGWQLGDWEYNWSTIYSEFALDEGEEYTFYFWLNGGENDHHDEVCELEIFGEDWNNRQVFTLCRDYTKPLIYKGGWFLFGVTFKAPDSNVTMRFHAQRAVMSLLPATITDLEMVPYTCSDDVPIDRPQRSNVVFRKGWPSKMQATKRIRIPFGRRIREVELTYPRMILIGILCCIGLLTIIGGAICLFVIIKTGRKVKQSLSSD